MSFDPNAFTLQLVQSLGQQIGQGVQQYQEQQVLGPLQEQIATTQNPEELLNLILGAQLSPQLTQETKSRLSQLAAPISQVTRAKEQNELRQLEIERRIAEQSEKNKAIIQEKTAPLVTALDRVQRMRDLSANRNIGRGSGLVSLFGGETARDKAEFEQLGKSLISLATTIPIRNRLEFETLAGQLIDATQPLAALEGALDAMETIIYDNMEKFIPGSKPKKAPTLKASDLENITLEQIQAEKERRGL